MPNSVELLLTENVDNLGIVGDVVTVRSGYARNYLLPNGYGVQPTESAKAALAERRAHVEKEMAALRADLEKTCELLDGHEVTLERSCNDQGHLYGSVTQHDIVAVLAEAGFTNILDRYIRIGHAIKRIDSYPIPVQLAPDLKAEIKLWVVADRPLDFDENAADEDGQADASADDEAAPAAADADAVPEAQTADAENDN
ncbi:MAG: 50S ribosomal protein L9 [Planctomycetes bacterium]|nr:50S ribosomal protein L9 [Planctomycetota bacterium]